MYNNISLNALKERTLSFIVSCVVLAAVAVPFAVAQAASSSYSFTMQYSVVDGCSNNESHTLDAGTGKLSGSTSASGSSIAVSYELQRDVFGFNPSYGSVNGGINTSFSNLAFPKSVVSASNYCIIASRNGFDGITVIGSGTLHN